MKDNENAIMQQIDNILLQLMQQMDGKLIDIQKEQQFKGALMKVLKRRGFPDELSNEYIDSLGCRNN